MSNVIYLGQLQVALNAFVAFDYYQMVIDNPERRRVKLAGDHYIDFGWFPGKRRAKLYVTISNVSSGWSEKYEYEFNAVDPRNGSDVLTHCPQPGTPWPLDHRKANQLITDALCWIIKGYTVKGEKKSDLPTETFGESAITRDNSINMSNKGLAGNVRE